MIPASYSEYINSNNVQNGLINEFSSIQVESPIDYGNDNSEFSQILFKNADILSGRANINNFDVSESSKKAAETIFNIFKVEINKIQLDAKLESIKLPQLLVSELNQSIYIEWPFKDARLGFSVGDDLDKTSWYFVANEKFQDVNFSGQLNSKNINDIIGMFIKFGTGLL